MQRVEQVRLGHIAWIGGQHAIDVRAKLTCGIQSCRDGDRGRVGSAAAQGRELPGVRNPLKTRDHGDTAGIELGTKPLGPHATNARMPVRTLGLDAHLPGAQRHRIHTVLLKRHREQRGRRALARGQKRVELARSGSIADRVGQLDQRIRAAPHRGGDHDASTGRRGDPLSHLVDSGRSGEGRAPKLSDQRARRITAHGLSQLAAHAGVSNVYKSIL